MAEDKKELNYTFSQIEKFYKAIQPNIVTTNKNVLYFNADLDDNAYPQKLIDLYSNASSVNSNFINLKKNLLVGDGLVPLEANAEFAEFVKIVNKSGDNFADVYEKLCFDLALFEAATMQIIYDSEGRVSRVYHVDTSTVRAEAPDEFGRVKNWYISKFWADISNRANRRASENNKAVKVASFDPENWEEDKVQLLYIRKYVAGSNVYSIPSYNSSTNYIQLDNELSKFQLNKVSGGMFVSGILYLNGDPDQKQKKDFQRDLDRNFKGTEGKKTMTVWGTGQDERPEFVRLEADKNDTLFNDLIAITAQKIATAHGGNLALAGIEGTGADLGGDANKLNTSLAFYNKTTVKPLRDTLLAGINKVLDVNQYPHVDVIWTPLNVDIEGEDEVDDTGDVTVEDVEQEM